MNILSLTKSLLRIFIIAAVITLAVNVLLIVIDRDTPTLENSASLLILLFWMLPVMLLIAFYLWLKDQALAKKFIAYLDTLPSRSRPLLLGLLAAMTVVTLVLGINLHNRNEKIALLQKAPEEQPAQTEPQEIQQLFDELTVFTIYAGGITPTQEQLAAFGIIDYEAWQHGVELGVQEVTTDFQNGESVSPLPESNSGFQDASLGLVAGRLLGCAEQFTDQCKEVRRYLPLTLLHAKADQNADTATMNCPERLASEEERMEALQQWMKAQLENLPEDATLEEMSEARLKYLYDNNCFDTLEYIRNNPAPAE